MKKVVVTGATGFIGGHLVRALVARGDEVTVLTRSQSSARGLVGVRAVEWNPSEAGDWYAALDGQDAVVSLAGEQAVGVRWTDAVKQRIVSSRVESNRQLVRAMARAKSRPSVLVGASAVGYYGARGNEAVDEGARAGDDFLARVCVQWEDAENEAKSLGVRVVNARVGIVLASDGGALQEMVKPFRLFAGGPIGSGEQVVAWVHIDDLTAIFLRLIDDETLSGPVNVAAPNAVTNAELAREIGRLLGRPSWVRAPALALKARFGEGAVPLLTGQRAVPKVLEKHGYVWRHPEIVGALRAALQPSS